MALQHVRIAVQVAMRIQWVAVIALSASMEDLPAVLASSFALTAQWASIVVCLALQNVSIALQVATTMSKVPRSATCVSSEGMPVVRAPLFARHALRASTTAWRVFLLQNVRIAKQGHTVM